MVLYIRIVGGDVAIYDDDNCRSDALKANTGDSVCWFNDTNRDCTLTFWQLDMAVPEFLGPVWPFRGNRSAKVRIPAQEGWCGTIEKHSVSKAAETCYVKYDVKVVGKPVLDPIVIIDH